MVNQKFNQVVKFPESYAAVADAVLVRLGELLPHLNIKLRGNEFYVQSDEEINRLVLKKEIMNALYRQRIFEQTLEIRSKVLG